jgi:hypothetical protein
MTYSRSSREPQRGGASASGADLSCQAHERLALEMLAAETGDVMDVRDAMVKILASAADGAGEALMLSLAMSRARILCVAGDEAKSRSRKARKSQLLRPSWIVGPNHPRAPSRWWFGAALPFLAMAALFWWSGELALQIPAEGTDASEIAALRAFTFSVGSLGIALIGIETLFLQRRQAGHPSSLPLGLVCPPGWYLDP